MSYVKDLAAPTTATASGTTLALTLTATASASNSAVICFGCVASQTITGITDSKGNTWTKAHTASQQSTTSPHTSTEIWFTTQDGGALTSGNTVTITLSAANTGRSAFIQEYSGQLTLDATATGKATAATTTLASGTTGATTVASEVAIAAFTLGSNQSSWTKDATYSLPTNNLAHSTAGFTLLSEYKDLSSTGTQSAGGTVTSTVFSGMIATFSTTGAGGGAPVNTAAPVASGTATVGQTLSCTTGTWTNSPTFAYQWQRDSSGNSVFSNIASATASTYLLVTSDGTCNVRCVVTATATGSASSNSNAIGPVGTGTTVGGGNNQGGPTTVFLGTFETVTPAYAPFDSVQAKNYGQVDTTHATFGNFFRDTAIVDQGLGAGRTDLLGNTTAPYERAECIKSRNIGIGTDDYYTMAYRFDPTWAGTPGGMILNQLNLQNLGPGGPTIAFRAFADHITLLLASGATQATSPAYQYNSNADSTNPNVNVQDMYALPVGQLTTGVWHEFIVHVHWALDTSGVIEVWHRVRGASAWTQTVSLPAGIAATLQYNKGVPISATNPPTGTFDKCGPYRPSSATPCSLWYDTFTRSGNFADANAAISSTTSSGLTLTVAGSSSVVATTRMNPRRITPAVINAFAAVTSLAPKVKPLVNGVISGLATVTASTRMNPRNIVPETAISGLTVVQRILALGGIGTPSPPPPSPYPSIFIDRRGNSTEARDLWNVPTYRPPRRKLKR